MDQNLRQPGCPDPCPVPTIRLCPEKFLLLQRDAKNPPLVCSLTEPEQQPAPDAIMGFARNDDSSQASAEEAA